jgi:selenocysteine-specific elongation factor
VSAPLAAGWSRDRMAESPASHPLIVGTAGHIDHGKTALIKLLTGIDTDRLKEEKERGITIELGFASLTLPSGLRLGVVDVPGHERFVRHMLAGAGGIDLILLVIAGDEGVMPQTREHVDIIELLGVSDGVVALTKTDMVEADFLELVSEDVRAYLEHTCLRGAPIIPVSAVTGQGKDELLHALDGLAQRVRHRDRGHMRRLPIDRVFTMEGFGTVVTGTLWAGRLRVGEPVRILPAGIETRVRALQVHNEAVEEALAGQRVAVLLHAVEKAAIQRGEWVTAGETPPPSPFIDARVHVLPSAGKPVENNARVRFHLGSAEVLGRAMVLEKDALKPGEEGWVQMRLEEPVLTERGDRFVLRTYSPMITVAGGTVVTAGVGKRRRLRAEDIEALRQAEKGTPAERVLAVLERRGGLGGDRDLLARESGCTAVELTGAIEELAAGNAAIAVSRKLIVAGSAFAAAGETLQRALTDCQRRERLSWGLQKSELKKKLESGIHEDLIEAWVQREIAAGRLFSRNDRLRHGDDRLTLSPEHEQLRGAMLAAIRAAGFAGRTHKEALEAAAGVARSLPKDAEALLLLLVDAGEIARVPPDLYIGREVLEELSRRVRAFFADHREMTVGDLKEMLGVSRKQAVPLLEHCDLNRLTLRRGDVRVPGPKLVSGG